MFDAVTYGPYAFTRILNQRSVTLEQSVVNTMCAILDLDHVQQNVQEKIDSATNEEWKKRRAKICKREVGQLARGLASEVAFAIQNRSSTTTLGDALKSAYEKWRERTTVRRLVNRYHKNPSGECAESLSLIG